MHRSWVLGVWGRGGIQGCIGKGRAAGMGMGLMRWRGGEHIVHTGSVRMHTLSFDGGIVYADCCRR